ncbi:beta-ketoacyl synthase N-terminal-like domain-containing protein [Henriciella marina]|uniref:Beta-ketoacyl synthase N-terminal-like domain-containing protein n=1 Tax=Henriciella marina TaxID=453851 RepID=A0ABT4LYB8_9PROT|nr:beta-ketoacyl synthase N-terminal-like domain-containing protein [Henriciella marina]MCZ4299361.1 beta-ketoacyl synthase N-terminal-like domain-containing protein [Henriciella marina]
MAKPTFEPIAIIGRGCVLPGALTPAELWQAVLEEKTLITDAPPGKWGVTEAEQQAIGYKGAFVTGFDKVFDPAAHDLGDTDASDLDPVFQWLLHAGREAWREAGQPKARKSRIGVIAGNLGYPSRALSDFAADIWLDGTSGIHSQNRFNTGGPAQLLARALGAAGPAFAVDAACASSLYAIKLACDRLQDHSLDVVIAAAVNGADNLILHQGFSALNALSPTGRSRPFVDGADGLVPAEGAAAIVLKRLSDCDLADRVFGVIRGIGLSNDGRRKSLLAPDGDGQREAMAAAWTGSGLDPARDIGLLEAHATGTRTGDAVELAATAAHFAGTDQLPIGSLKGNLGHLITAAGMASLIKLTYAVNEGTIPPTRLEGAAISGFEGSGLTPARQGKWPDDRPRVAALSNFGFGGNNAHLILAADDGQRARRKTATPVRKPPHIAITATGLSLGPDRGVARVLQRLMRPPMDARGPMLETHADPKALRAPPSDLSSAQGQQVALWDAVDGALARTSLADGARVGVYTGFSCSPEATRWMLRARIAQRLDLVPTSPEADEARNAIAAPLKAGDVLGAMPNVSANRLNVRGDWRALGFAVMEEEASGLRAAELAIRALQAGEIDAAIVAAADLSADIVHAATGSEHTGDAAAALILQRSADAPSTTEIRALRIEEGTRPNAMISRIYGHAHAAGGLVELGLQAEAAVRGLELGETGLVPRLGSTSPRPAVAGAAVKLKTRPQPTPDLLRPPPRLETYGAESRDALIASLEAQRQSSDGNLRIALLGTRPEKMTALRLEAASRLRAGSLESSDGIIFGEGAPEGDLAFVFTGAAAAYPGMGRDLFSAFPSLGKLVTQRFPTAQSVADTLATGLESAFSQLRATTLVSQAQHLLLTQMLGLKPTVAVGLSSGETNSLIAFGAWVDADGLMGTIGESGMYDRYLAGAFETARKAWGEKAPIEWATWRLRTSEAAVRDAIKPEPRCDITIIYSASDVVISGEASACQRVIKRLGAAAIRVPHDLTVHTPAMLPYEKTWHQLHFRKTKAPKAVRFYANAINGAYEVSADSAANMLTGQAIAPIDFPATLHAAHADGVRTFIEIGPRDTLTGAIEETLGPSVTALSTDRFGKPALDSIAMLAARLFAGGHALNIDWLKSQLDEASANTLPLRIKDKSAVTFDAHAAPPRTPQLPSQSRQTARRRLTPPKRPSFNPGPLPSAKPALARTLPLPPGASWVPPVVKTVGTAVLERKRTAAGQAPSPAPNVAPARRMSPAPAQAHKSISPLERKAPTGPSFTRAQIEQAAVGNISDIFGKAFAAQDKYRRQVRMPRAPMLLCDRITGIDAEALVHGKGTIWTETDVTADLWAVSDGMLRPGPLIEAGQADLALISWMGADMLNCSDRVYRLLGCELTFHEGGLPRVGETLRFQISIKGHAELSGVRMFFFEYDCYADDRLLLSVRNGQAGFFTDEELANSKGVLWDAAEGAPTAEPRLDKTSSSTKRSFTAAEVAAFRAGDTYRCFGEGFERAAPHTRPARIPDGKLALFDEVLQFDPEGGPWGRGYLKARHHVSKDAWFYDGHFHEDPCMPGTLMAEAAVQALEFTAAGLGLTIERDSHVFEPAPGAPATFYCRGQVTPDTDHEVTYEVFVDEIIDGEEPMVFASLLARSDGRKVFYCPRFGVRLRRQWPKPDKLGATPHYVNTGCDVRGDEAALIECGSGAPSNAFGSMYAPFDTKGAVPRLPQPPYHMVSRVISVSEPAGQQGAGLEAVAEYDIPEDAWYFEDGGTGTMPFSVLTEVILQPCGWLASYSGFALSGETRFRNLDGKGTLHRQVRPEDGMVRTTTTLTRCSRVGPMTIVFFALEATLADGTPIISLETSFGFFTNASLAAQAGLKPTDADRDFVNAPADPPSEADTRLKPSQNRLALFDVIDRFEPTSGEAALGRIRARQAVDPYAWYFKAHFFSDPVQPGSLGLDMLVQLLARAADLNGHADRFDHPVWEPIAETHEVNWTYRGQVMPTAKQATPMVEVLSVEEEDDATIVKGRGVLWVDGLKIYEMRELSVRICTAHAPSLHRHCTMFSAGNDGWLQSHRPTHTLPSLPLLAQAGMALRQARAAGFEGYPIELKTFSPRRWGSLSGDGLSVETRVTPDGETKLRGRDALSDDATWYEISAGKISQPVRGPKPKLVPRKHGKKRGDPYASGDLFHGPAMQSIISIRRDKTGFEAVLNLAAATNPGDPFDPVILDGLVHGPPHETPEEWFKGAENTAIYPVRLERLTVLHDLPESGKLTVRGRPQTRLEGSEDLPVLIEAYLEDGSLWARLDLVEKAYPKGKLGALNPLARKAFLTGRSDEVVAPLSWEQSGRSLVSPAAVMACDWLPGTVAAAWGLEGLTGADLIKGVAVKEFFARKWQVHPQKLTLDPPFVIGPNTRSRYDLSFDKTARAWSVGDDPHG